MGWEQDTLVSWQSLCRLLLCVFYLLASQIECHYIFLPVFCILVTFYDGSHQTALKTASMNTLVTRYRCAFIVLGVNWILVSCFVNREGACLRSLLLNRYSVTIFPSTTEGIRLDHCRQAGVRGGAWEQRGHRGRGRRQTWGIGEAGLVSQGTATVIFSVICSSKNFTEKFKLMVIWKQIFNVNAAEWGGGGSWSIAGTFFL